MTKNTKLKQKVESKRQPKKAAEALELASFGVTAVTAFVYLTLIAVNISEIPDLRGNYESFIYAINVLLSAWQGALLFFVTVAICIMLVIARSQPFRFLARYAIMVLVLTIYPLPFVYDDCPFILSLMILVLLFTLPVIKLYQYIYARCSMRAVDCKKYKKAIAKREEEDIEKQKKYSVMGVVIGIIIVISTLVAYFGSMTNNLAVICGIFAMLIGMPLGCVTVIVLIAYIVAQNKRLNNFSLILCIVGIVLCLLPFFLFFVGN